VKQQSLVPSVNDPSLWMFGCATGKEGELVFQIMNKSVAMARQGRPLGITAAVAAQTKGRVYVESYSEPAVLEAIQGVRQLLQYTMRLVPISDMTTVLTVIPQKKPVKVNDWVRICRGHFKGDLALVKAVKDGGLRAVIQCVPRIDLTLSDLSAEQAKIRRKTIRPPQKFFSHADVTSTGKNVDRVKFTAYGNTICDYFEGNYYQDGYLLKEMMVGTMIKPCGEDEPYSIEELQKFSQRAKNNDGYEDGDDDEENEGRKIASSLLDQLSELQGKTSLVKKTGEADRAGLIVGDTVEVVEGDLVGMRGRLVSLDGTTVKIMPTSDDLGITSEVEFLASQVRKHIAEGAHVKVVTGHYANETGTVVAVHKDDSTDYTAVVLTDMTHKEISVRVSQLRVSAEVASGRDKLAGYELHDLVVLSGGGSANEVGVITRVGREEFAVINNHGVVREVRPEELRGKRNSSSSRAMALDAQGNQIKCGDAVTVADGPHKGKTATIKRLSRSQLFLYQQTRTENSGIFVVRSRSCLLTGTHARRNNEGAVPAFQSRRSGPNTNKDDALFAKTVRIQSGTWKGYIGVVTDSTPTHVQVELHSRLKKVMVVKERVAAIGDRHGPTEGPQTAHHDSIAPGTPFLGGATPMHGAPTPMNDGMGTGFTPSHSNVDDVWRPGDMDRDDQPATPSHGWANDAAQSAGSGWGTSPKSPSAGGWASSAQGSKTPPPADPPDVSGDDTHPWLLQRVCVQTVDSEGVVTKINARDNSATVRDARTDATATFRAAELKLIQPKEHDVVIVTGGSDKGVEGELVCIDGTDAILKDSNDDFKIVEFFHLAKIFASN